MSTFVIHSHGRLHEWIAEEKGYYAAEGLTDYALGQEQPRTGALRRLVHDARRQKIRGV